MHNCWIF